MGASSGIMSETFRGEYDLKIDGKARLLIPAAFRRVLDLGDERTPESPRTRMVIVYGGKKRNFCECYSFAESEDMARQIRLLPPGSDARLKAERNLVTLSATVELDDDGRIVLPPKVREKLGIAADDLKGGVDTVLAGATNRFTLWRKEVYDAIHRPQDDEDDDEDDVDPLVHLQQVSMGG